MAEAELADPRVIIHVVIITFTEYNLNKNKPCRRLLSSHIFISLRKGNRHLELLQH